MTGDNGLRRCSINVLGCEMNPLTLDETVGEVDRLIQAGEPAQGFLVNADTMLQLRDDARLSEIVAACALVTADGQSIVWAARLLGNVLPERVAGPDLFDALLELAAQKDYSVFFLGARPGIAARAARRSVTSHPGLRIAGVHHGYFEEKDSEAVVEAVREARPHMLFVGMPSPRKDYWVSDNLARLGAPFALGVGGTFDVVAGVVARAPVCMQRAGLEWVYRLCQEPGRMWKRYLIGNMRFGALVVRELCERRANTRN